MEEENKQILKQHLGASLSAIKTYDPDMLELVAKFLREIDGEPVSAVTAKASDPPTVSRQQRKPRNPYSLSCRVGRFTRDMKDPFTCIELLKGMQIKGLGQQADTADLIRSEVLRKSTNTYMCIDRGADRWIRRKNMSRAA